MTKIHETALVDDNAELAEGVAIGPYCVVGADVTLGESVTLISHVVMEGSTKVGANTAIYPFTSIGHRPQDLKYRGEPSTLVIGRNNTIREHVTMNPGTEGGGKAGSSMARTWPVVSSGSLKSAPDFPFSVGSRPQSSWNFMAAVTSSDP